MAGKKDQSALKASKPLKEPPMKGYRDKLGTSERHRTKLEERGRSVEVALDQKAEVASRGFMLGSLCALVLALLVALGVNWLLA